jgi:hypothetical protein
MVVKRSTPGSRRFTTWSGPIGIGWCPRLCWYSFHFSGVLPTLARISRPVMVGVSTTMRWLSTRNA